MAASILESGDKVLVAHRRLFEKDRGRFFVGAVDGYEDGIARVSGYSWIHDTFGGTCIRKADKRTKLLSVQSGGLIFYVLPRSVDIEKVSFRAKELSLCLVEGKQELMDLSELSHRKTS